MISSGVPNCKSAECPPSRIASLPVSRLFANSPPGAGLFRQVLIQPHSSLLVNGRRRQPVTAGEFKPDRPSMVRLQKGPVALHFSIAKVGRTGEKHGQFFLRIVCRHERRVHHSGVDHQGAHPAGVILGERMRPHAAAGNAREDNPPGVDRVIPLHRIKLGCDLP